MIKQAKPRDFDSVGYGPQSIMDAFKLLEQARAIARPTPAQLGKHTLSRGGFTGSVERITEKTKPTDTKYNLSNIAGVKPGTIAGVGTGVSGALGLIAAVQALRGNDVGAGVAGTSALAGLGATAYLTSKQNTRRKNLRNTAKLLREYGLNKPELLHKMAPIIR